MSLIIATGTNLGDLQLNLERARQVLQHNFELIAASRIYRSGAVDNTSQPDFFNQVLEFSLPSLPPDDVMKLLLEIERSMGRRREAPKGPRVIDLDIIFWGQASIQSDLLHVPHPRWKERSFVVRPLSELPFFQTVQNCFTMSESFEVEAFPI